MSAALTGDIDMKKKIRFAYCHCSETNYMQSQIIRNRSLHTTYNAQIATWIHFYGKQSLLQYSHIWTIRSFNCLIVYQSAAKTDKNLCPLSIIVKAGFIPSSRGWFTKFVDLSFSVFPRFPRGKTLQLKTTFKAIALFIFLTKSIARSVFSTIHTKITFKALRIVQRNCSLITFSLTIFSLFNIQTDLFFPYSVYYIGAIKYTFTMGTHCYWYTVSSQPT